MVWLNEDKKTSYISAIGLLKYMVSRPEIALHKKTSVMNATYLKRTQKDYPLSLKLQIVRSIEFGKLSTAQATKIMVFNVERL